MTLQEFTRDIVPILQLLVAVLGLLSIVFVWWQIRESRLWNKMTNQMAMTNSDALVKREFELTSAYKRLNITGLGRRALTRDEIEKIRHDEEANRATSVVLADFEMLGATLSIGAADDDFAYAILGARLVDAYATFRTLIDDMRERQADTGLFIEFEKTAAKWAYRVVKDAQDRDKRLAKQRQEIARYEAKITALKRNRAKDGAQPKI